MRAKKKSKKLESDRFKNFPNGLHTLDEESVCYRIRKKSNDYTIKLIQDAQRAGRLPSGRALAVRAFNRELKKAFSGVIPKE